MAVPMGKAVKLYAKGMRTGFVHEPILNTEQLAKLEASPEKEPFDGDPQRFRLGIEGLRLALAYEHDPYFSLSIARVDPLPHQLEAVYDYFLKTARLRFLLADDPGAGKTIMAGLTIKELKIRGLVKRILIVTPANGSKTHFAWPRQLLYRERGKFNPDAEPNFKEEHPMARQQLSDADLAAIRDLAKRWGKVVARHAFGPDGPGLNIDLTAMEQVACAAAQGLTEGTVEHLLDQQAAQLPAPHLCPTCGRPCPVQREPRSLTMVGAEIEYREPVCYCPSCRRDFFPSASGAAPGQPRLQSDDPG
jgi:hypothetical protein